MMLSYDCLDTYDYALPPELIAQHPLPERDASRLLVVRRAESRISHQSIRELPDLLQPGDCLVLNNSRVLPARLFGIRTRTGGKWEGLFLSTNSDGRWRLIGQTRGWLNLGETVTIPSPHHADLPPLELRLIDREADGVWVMEPLTEKGSSYTARTLSNSPFSPASGEKVPKADEGVVTDTAMKENPLTLALSPAAGERGPDNTGAWTRSREISPVELLQLYGAMPLPPYIERDADDADQERYQTTYASRPGSVAAPTAGLHFTPELLARCRANGIDTAEVTLHVGIGTFRPVSVNDLAQHVMHAEYCDLSAATAQQLSEVRQRGGRIIAVGTTSARTLESAYAQVGWQAWSGDTKLFIRPPYQFQAVDALLTNFHLPKSTLLMLVSALAGVDLIRSAYVAAIAERYRFFSYGDAMLIV